MEDYIAVKQVRENELRSVLHQSISPKLGAIAIVITGNLLALARTSGIAQKVCQVSNVRIAFSYSNLHDMTNPTAEIP